MPSFEETLQSFAGALRDEERSDQTIRCYLSQLNRFAGWFRQRYGLPVDLIR